MTTGDVAALQRILGHKTITMTMRYSHFMTEHLHSVMQKDGAARRTNPGTAREDISGKLSTDPSEDEPAKEVPATTTRS